MSADLDEIKRLPIRGVAKRLGIKVLSGSRAMCFGRHDKLTPSLSFHVRKNYWHCFGCGLGGSTIDLVMRVLGCDFKTALSWFANEYAMQPLRSRGGRPINLRRRSMDLNQFVRSEPKQERRSRRRSRLTRKSMRGWSASAGRSHSL